MEINHNDEGGFPRQRRSTSIGTSQWTGFEFVGLDSWASYLTSSITGCPSADENPLDFAMSPLNTSQPAQVSYTSNPPLSLATNFPNALHPTHTSHRGLSSTNISAPSNDDLMGPGLSYYDKPQENRCLPSETVHQGKTTTETVKGHEEQLDSDCHHHSGETGERNLSETTLFKCQWKDCGSKGTFSNEGSLVRHIKDMHISPDKYRCMYPRCKKSFGRKDRFQDHLRLKHPELSNKVCKQCRTGRS